MKAGLIVELGASEEQRDHLRRYLYVSMELRQIPKLTTKILRSVDRKLQDIFEMLKPECRAPLEAQLLQRFGYSFLYKPGISDDTILKRVLRRGKLLSDDEAEVVTGFMADTTNAVGPEQDIYEKLGFILDSYRGPEAR